MNFLTDMWRACVRACVRCEDIYFFINFHQNGIGFAPPKQPKHKLKPIFRIQAF